MQSIADVLGFPCVMSNGRGGWVCSACGGGIRREVTSCKHCGANFADIGLAHNIYQESLRTLKANPTSADLRQRALSVGRAYSALTRQNNVTIYDEMAVMNDIEAATAGASSASSAAADTPNRETIEARLRRLDDLHTKGLVSAEEREARRQKILDEL